MQTFIGKVAGPFRNKLLTEKCLLLARGTLKRLSYLAKYAAITRPSFPMKQMAFADAEYGDKRKQTRKKLFLSEIDLVVPWKRLAALIEPHYPKGQPVVRRIR